MKNILITGATGNIGFEVIRYLYRLKTPHKIIAGARNIEKAQAVFKEFQELNYVHFDFEDPKTFENALKNINTMFLLRPPHISDIEKYFKPLISQIKKYDIKEVVFLSVQGAEKSKIIPHNKIEQLIKEYELNHIFLRPSYFMQNLTTTLIEDINIKREIILPAGKAKFNWIDIENIGEASAVLLNKFEDMQNQAYEITGKENESFDTVTHMINEVIDHPIKYRNVNPLAFYRIKKAEGMVKGMIVVMILLHFLPRFQKEPSITDFYEQLTGKRPTSIKEFIIREKVKFEQQ